MTDQTIEVIDEMEDIEIIDVEIEDEPIPENMPDWMHEGETEEDILAIEPVEVDLSVLTDTEKFDAIAVTNAWDALFQNLAVNDDTVREEALKAFDALSVQMSHSFKANNHSVNAVLHHAKALWKTYKHDLTLIPNQLRNGHDKFQEWASEYVESHTGNEAPSSTIRNRISVYEFYFSPESPLSFTARQYANLLEQPFGKLLHAKSRASSVIDNKPAKSVTEMKKLLTSKKVKRDELLEWLDDQLGVEPDLKTEDQGEGEGESEPTSTVNNDEGKLGLRDGHLGVYLYGQFNPVLQYALDHTVDSAIREEFDILLKTALGIVDEDQD